MDQPVTQQAWVGLRIEVSLANTDEDIDRNIEYALTRKVIGFQDLVGKSEGAVSVVGSGPSLKDTWHRIEDEGGDIIACNAAGQFLLERGIVPKYVFFFDADPLMLEFITPHPDITYLVASRCPPKAFDMLEGCKVVMWHAMGDNHIMDILVKHSRMEPLISGGTAAITRGMVLAEPMGYRTIHLWGCDSSFKDGETHIRQSTTVEKRMPIMCGDRIFECAPWMAQQANDFKILAPALRDLYGVKIVVHGDGLIPHIAKLEGYDVDGEARSTQIWREAKVKARTLWSQL